jgi:hypothetical protein
VPNNGNSVYLPFKQLNNCLKVKIIITISIAIPKKYININPTNEKLKTKDKIENKI